MTFEKIEKKLEKIDSFATETIANLLRFVLLILAFVLVISPVSIIPLGVVSFIRKDITEGIGFLFLALVCFYLSKGLLRITEKYQNDKNY